MAKLGEICTFQSGGTPSKNKPEYFGGEIPWISTTALNGGKINETDAVAWITPKAIRESAAKIVPANSIMIGTRVGIGKVAINTVEMSTSQDVISLINIDEDKWYKPYLCKLLLSKKDYFNSQARGATIKGIKIDVVANIDVPEIDYATQKKVAATLNKIDTLIVLRKQQLEKLDELVKARFVEMFETRKYPIEKLGRVCEKITDGTHKTPTYLDSGIRFISAKNIIDGKVDLTDTKYISKNEYQEIQKRCQVEIQDILLTKSGTLGMPAIIRTDCALGLFESLAVIKYDRSKLLPYFLYEQLRCNRVQRQFKAGTKGVAVKHLHLGVISAIDIIVPPISFQLEFSDFAEQVDKQKQTVQRSLEKLELMKKALMQEYFG